MIKVNSLRVDYENTNAVHDLDLDVSAGQIFGLVGPNGAGKTSTIKALAGIIEPTYGDIKVLGYDLELERQKALNRVGYMPDFPPVYEHLKVWEYLDVFAAAYNIPSGERAKKIRSWVARVNLESKHHAFIRDLSRGMRQRLVLAKTLIPDPDVLLLDEPASGLDPIARKDMRDVLKDVASANKAVIISSHILSELSDFCNAVGIMQQGKLLVSGSVEDIRRHVQSKGRLIVFLSEVREEMIQEAKSVLHGFSCVEHVEERKEGGLLADFSGCPADASLILAQLVLRKIPVCGFQCKEDNVEDLFFKMGMKEVA